MLLILILSPVIVLLPLVGFVLPPLLISKLKAAGAPAWEMLRRVAFVRSIGLICLLRSVLAFLLYMVAFLVISIIVSFLVFFWMLILLLALFKRICLFLPLGVFIVLSLVVFFAILLLALLLLTFLFFLLLHHL